LLQTVVEELGNPIATTSIHDENDEIQDYFSDPYEIYQRFENQIELIVDGGTGNLYASTVVDCTTSTHQILRQGIGNLVV
jgi:tRNA A37 threonylcarbamoyladenosine synthetase subunit TsaC/SUA5/YrdC